MFFVDLFGAYLIMCSGKNMRLFDEWLGRLSWREISSYEKKLDGFCVPDETSEFLDSFTV